LGFAGRTENEFELCGLSQHELLLPVCHTYLASPRDHCKSDPTWSVGSGTDEDEDAQTDDDLSELEISEKVVSNSRSS
jgi:hypothetical protein